MVAGTISAWTCNDSIASVSSEEELENPSVRYPPSLALRRNEPG